MKISILKSSFLLLALFASAAFTSCKKDEEEDLKKNIVGVWDVTSFKVAGFEYMNNLVESASIEYEAFTGAQGDFSQTIKYVDEDPEENIAGKYEILDGESVKMTADGESNTVKIKIDGDNFELEGKQDGQSFVMKAERRD